MGIQPFKSHLRVVQVGPDHWVGLHVHTPGLVQLPFTHDELQTGTSQEVPFH